MARFIWRYLELGIRPHEASFRRHPVFFLRITAVCFLLVIDISIMYIYISIHVFVHVYLQSWTFACSNMEKTREARWFLSLFVATPNATQKPKAQKSCNFREVQASFIDQRKRLKRHPGVSHLADSNRAWTWIEYRCIRLDEGVMYCITCFYILIYDSIVIEYILCSYIVIFCFDISL